MKKNINGNIDIKPYKDVVDEIPDIPVWAFREAARLVDTDGRIYNGPEAGYKALSIGGKWPSLLEKYRSSNFFKYASDHGYAIIARHRKIFFYLTKLVFGKTP